MSAGGYESWFLSARDPASRRALWIRHTRHRPVQGPESVALWCTVADPDLGRPPGTVKQVFTAFPPDAAAGPGQFRGKAVIGQQTARWDLAIARRAAAAAAVAPAGVVPFAATAHQA